MPPVHGRRLDGHRAVEEHLPVAELPLVEVRRELVEDLLAAAHGEGRDQHVAAVAPRIAQDAAEFRERVGSLAVQARAVSALHEQQVRAGAGLGIAQDRRVVLAEVAAERQAPLDRALAEREPHARRAQDVAGVAEHELDPREHLDGAAVRHGAQLLQHVHRVGERVERLRRRLAPVARAPAVLTLRVALLHGGRVGEQDAHQVAAGCSGVDRAAEAALAQQRQAAAVVDVRVAQDDGVDAGRLEGELGAVALAGVGAALDHAAVEQQPAAAHGHDVAGTGDFTGPAVELQLHRLASGDPLADGRLAVVGACLALAQELHAGLHDPRIVAAPGL